VPSGSSGPDAALDPCYVRRLRRWFGFFLHYQWPPHGRPDRCCGGCGVGLKIGRGQERGGTDQGIEHHGGYGSTFPQSTWVVHVDEQPENSLE
jgi:hypothetical protein